MCKKDKRDFFKLNNKGFAITSIIYSMLLLFIVLMTLIILTLGRKKVMLDKSKNETLELLGKVSTNYEYFYTGDVQTFVAPRNGYYNVELWGAQGGNMSGTGVTYTGASRGDLKYYGGKGAYTTGSIYLNQGDTLYVYVGGKGSDNVSLTSCATNGDAGGYNGGGSLTPGQCVYGSSGGGATDIRLEGGSWNDFNSLKSRIMVAAGGGGANFRNEGYGEGNGGAGGTLSGLNGLEALTPDSYFRPDYPLGYGIGTGGTQVSGGYNERHFLDGNIEIIFLEALGFGYHQNEMQSGGGSGYYVGGGSGHGGAGGGSSFISGYTGCDAIASDSTETNIIHTGQSVHYSGKQFSNPKMIAGNSIMPTYDGNNIMLGNAGDGHAKITYVGRTPYAATNLIKNGSFENGNTNNFNNEFGSLMTKSLSDIRYSGNYSMSLTASTSSNEVYAYYTENSNSLVFDVLPNRYYYCSAMYLSPNSGVQMFFYPNNWNINNSKVDSSGPASSGWMKLSTYLKYEGQPVGFWFRLDNNNNYKVATSYFDDVLCLDLTETFGAGNEPTKEWCDENISYFDGTAILYK